MNDNVGQWESANWTELNWTGDSQIPYFYFEVVAIICISSAHALTELLAPGTTV